jgi:peroxisomal trans-2-enoyl-CoA reductase
LSAGAGFAITRELLSLGCNVVIASRKMDALREAVKELKGAKLQGEVDCVGCNIREEAEVKRLFEFTLDRFGRLDHLVNNGGGQFPSPASAISSNGWRSVVDLNLNGTFVCCREAFAAGMGEKGGNIVNIVGCCCGRGKH